MPAAAPRRTAFGALLAVAVLAVAAWVAWDGGRILMADLTALRARWLVGQWAAGATKPPTPAEWTAARGSLQAALGWTPDDPELHDALGDLHAVAGVRDWDDEAARTAAYRQAVAHYRDALALRPADPQIWASLAGALVGADQRETPAFGQAWARALQLGPHEGHVQPMLMWLALSNWEVATPVMRDWVHRFHAAAAPPQREALHKVAARHGLRFDADGRVEPLPSPPVDAQAQAQAAAPAGGQASVPRN